MTKPLLQLLKGSDKFWMLSNKCRLLSNRALYYKQINTNLNNVLNYPIIFILLYVFRLFALTIYIGSIRSHTTDETNVWLNFPGKY